MPGWVGTLGKMTWAGSGAPQNDEKSFRTREERSGAQGDRAERPRKSTRSLRRGLIWAVKHDTIAASDVGRSTIRSAGPCNCWRDDEDYRLQALATLYFL